MVAIALLGALLTSPYSAPRTEAFTSYEVEIIKDIPYYQGPDADAGKHKLDLYLPRGKKDFPVLFFVHGGSWKTGDRRKHEDLGSVFARTGIGAVIISYRLAPQVHHPAQIEDVACAFAWTYANIGRFGGRADQLFACGHSAGGHLVSLLATDESYLKSQKLTFACIRGVISMSGVYLLQPKILFEAVFGKDEEVVRKASPLEHVSGHHAPFLLLYAEKELPLLAQGSERMCKALQQCDCEASILEIKGHGHNDLVHRAASRDDPAFQAVVEFISRHLSSLHPSDEKR